MPDKHPDKDPRSPDRSEKELFFDALEIEDATERAAWLEEACGDDADLFARVLELLKVEEEDHAEFLEPDQDRLDEAVAAVGHQLRDDDPEAETMASDPGEEAAHRAAAGIGEQRGDQIGRYELLEPIGEGGMGVVWMAQQREPVERKVALKVIKLGMDKRRISWRPTRRLKIITTMRPSAARRPWWNSSPCSATSTEPEKNCARAAINSWLQSTPSVATGT